MNVKFSDVIRRVVFYVSAAFMATSVAYSSNALKVEGTDGRSFLVKLSDHPVVTYSDSEICFDCYDVSFSYPQNESVTVTFIELQNSSSPEVEFSNLYPLLSSVPGGIMVEGLSPACPVFVFDLTGISHVSANADETGCFFLPTCSLRKGIYVVSAGPLTQKFIVK